MTNTYLSRINNKIYWAVVIALIIAIIFFRLDTKEAQPTTPAVNTEKVSQAQSTTQPSSQLSSQLPAQSIKASKIESLETITTTSAKSNQLSTSSSATKHEHSAAWGIASGKVPAPSIRLNERISDYEAIEIQRPENFPKAGDQIVVPMLNGETLIVDVQSTTTNGNGDSSWSGHLQGHNDDYPIVVTYGETSSFAMITTPKGSYTMESINGSGWLYKNPSEAELSKPGAVDYLVPNITP